MPSPPKAAPAAVPSAAELQALVATLEDDTAREELVARLKALTAAPPQDERGAIADAIDSINHEIGERVDTVGAALAGLADSVGQMPVLARWSWQQLTDPLSRGVWLSVGRQIGAAVLAGLLASVLVRLLLRGWRDRKAALPLAARRSARLKASLAHLTVNLLSLGTFLGVTHLALGYDDVSFLARRVAVDVLVAIGCVRGLTAVSKAVLAPENPRRRLVGVDDATARETQRWLGLLLGLGFYGYFALAAGRRLGLPWAVHGFLLHALFLVVTVLVVTVIYRLRAHLGAAIERWGHEGSSANIARYLPWQAFAAVGHHVLAAWAGLVFLVWAVGAPDGAWLLTRGLVVTVAALVAVRALDVWLDWRFGGRHEPAPESDAAGDGHEEQQEEEVEPRTAAHVAAVTSARIAAVLVALLVVLQAWGVDVAGWVRADTGRAVLVTLGRIAAIAAIVLAAARIVQRVAARYIGATDAAGNLIYSNRTRTLVSMARNLALTLLVAIGAVEVLSELGVNANALLAGAGVVGLAIGFGAQTLVKDLITGLFILVGDTVRVGDVVDLGGKGGVVEAISMRTITLRDYNGNVHTIPYSSIDVVTNMTKDFSFYVFDVNVAYKEDVDRVVELLREIDAKLRREWPYRRLILEPLEIAGVDAFRDSAVLVKARIKVRPGEQWKVGREFNRRIKRRFDEAGIEIPFPHQKLYFGGDLAQDLPPQAIEQLRREALANDTPVRRAAGEG
jgi:moderate conductance mechanosensitive channel